MACSTPVGVKDRFTRFHCVDLANFGIVLNACRRQRSVHAVIFGKSDPTVECSTPVGVKDRFTMFPAVVGVSS